ncbi:MAG: bifunctional 23S rRNA (guanine(2069)-N(7))-methyltransferase RlmK/23S rRNA (guanine(2445)-N(2))-methyltransferase RlmL [Myxococcota bacterium]
MTTPVAGDRVATCPRGTEDVLVRELQGLGLPEVRADRGAVRFGGALRDAYRACLWSRVASRVLWPVARLEVADAEALYAGTREVPWEDHLHPDRTLAVQCVGSHAVLTDRRYVALKVKDAVVDRLRDRHGRRPDVDPHRPDLRLHVHLDDPRATVSLDLSGEALHRRGYRPSGAPAPLKENLAAAILWLGGWAEAALEGVPLVDPLCGSGTLLVEAAWMALDVAPGLGRDRFGFEGWLQHDAAAWAALVAEARAARVPTRGRAPFVFGFDVDGEALARARQSARAAGVDAVVRVERRALAECEPPVPGPGLVVTNPPYGERLGEAGELGPLYETLGDVLRRRFVGWHAFVLSGNPALTRQVGLRPRRRHVLFNGPIECRLLDYPIAAVSVKSEEGPRWRGPSDDASMVANRLRKNRRRWGRWARREGIACYRLYDAEIPEYNVAIDVYGDAIHVQEYERPPRIDPDRAEAHLRDVRAVVPEVLDVSPDDVFVKVRRRQRGGAQYEKRGELGVVRTVTEGGLRFEVNLSDYLDTGLFLDQRIIRARIGARARGARFLNLFAYTGSATVYAAAGGARASTSVDLSNTYLDWAGRNLALNGLERGDHAFVRADVMDWLARERGRYDLIYVAPPTYSRSKGMRGDFDLQRDHGRLLRGAAARLAPGGVLYFTTHLQRFALDPAVRAELALEDASSWTVPPDFARSPHHAFVHERR